MAQTFQPSIRKTVVETIENLESLKRRSIQDGTLAQAFEHYGTLDKAYTKFREFARKAFDIDYCGDPSCSRCSRPEILG